MTQAKFTTPDGLELKVDFNPASLKLSVTNTMQDDQPSGQGGQQQQANDKARQNVRKSATKLETELIFDTTETDSPKDKRDVRLRTSTLKAMARPKSAKDPALSQVTLEWGVFKFTGLIESISETLDFWSGDGVPLRATVQLVMQSLELDVMTPEGAAPTRTKMPPDGRGATGAATKAGDPGAGRAVAAANGLESMRMPAGGDLVIGADVELKAAAAFSAGASAGFGASASAGFAAGASAGFGAGASAGFAAGASAGFGAGASAGLGAGASAGFAAGASAGFAAGAASIGGAGFGAGGVAVVGATFGASASAGVSATGGAFAGLGVAKRVTSSARLDPLRLLPSSGTRQIGSDATFDVTGRVVTGSGGVSVNVRREARVRIV